MGNESKKQDCQWAETLKILKIQLEDKGGAEQQVRVTKLLSSNTLE